MKIIESGKCGDNVSYEFTEDGVLRIFGIGGIFNYNHEYFYKKENIKRVIIAKGVTMIGNCAFEGCISLKSINIPNSVTKIGRSAFEGCTSLESIVIPNGVTEIGNFAFEGCTSLKSIEIPDSVTKIGWNAFRGCISLKSIEVPDSVMDVGGGAFENTVWFNNHPDGVVYINNKFLYKYKGVMPENTHIKVKEGIIQICGEAFGGCTSLKSIDIPNSVTEIGEWAFHCCISLESIEIPNSVTKIGWNTFEGCTSLKSIDIPNSVIKIREEAFKGCISLKSINISNSVTEIGWNTFEGCTSLKSIDIPNSITEIESETFKGCISLKSIGIPNSVTRIEGGTFEGCTSLESIDIPDSVTKIFKDAFDECTSLKMINIPLKCSFCCCKNFIGREFIVSSAKEPFSIKCKGKECRPYEKINFSMPVYVPKSSKKAYLEHEEWGRFTNIKEIDGQCGENSYYELLDNGTLNVFGKGEMYDDFVFDKSQIKKVVVAENISMIGANAFKDCRRLRIVEMDSPLEEIADGAFSGCENIFSMTIASEIPPIVSEHTLEGLMRTTEIRVPANAIRYYKAAKYWNEFTNYVAID